MPTRRQEAEWLANLSSTLISKTSFGLVAGDGHSLKSVKQEERAVEGAAMGMSDLVMGDDEESAAEIRRRAW